MYLTYDKYREYGGKLDEAAYSVYGFEAEMRVNAETHGRIKTATEPISRCVAKIIDILAKADITQDKVTSWNNDGVSKSVKDFSIDDYEKKIKSIIRDYLANEVDENGTPLLYLGVGK